MSSLFIEYMHIVHVFQMTLKCLLLFIKLQAEYHQLCSNLVSSAIDHLTIMFENQENTELLQQVQSLKLKQLAPMQTPVQHAILSRKMSASGNNSPKALKHGLKASLFSLFERKNSPEEGKSSFYVDIDQKKDVSDNVSTSQSEDVSHSHMTQNSQSDVLIDLGLDPNPSVKTQMEGVTPAFGNSGLSITCTCMLNVFSCRYYNHCSSLEHKLKGKLGEVPVVHPSCPISL